MPENIRAYIVIFGLSIFSLFILDRLNPLPDHHKQSRQWASYWIIVTSAAFLTFNYWVFVFIVSGLLLVVAPKAPNGRLSTYFFLLPALPILENEVPGFAGVRYFFDISYPRLLVLCILLPLAVSTFRERRLESRTSFFPSDKYLFGYVGLALLLAFRDPSITNSLRSCFYIILEILIPYYVISRQTRSLGDFKSIFLAIFSSAFVLSVIAWFEALKYWLLYKSLGGALGISVSRFSGYGRREGFLRIGTTMTTIPFGYFMMIGFGALSFFKPYISGFRFMIFGGAIIGALLATISRGPWVGFAGLVLVSAFYSPRRVKALALLIAAGLFGLSLLTVIPGGDKFLSLLPFIGSGGHAAETVSYRQQLFETGIDVIKANPLFGSPTYRQDAEMEAIRQGQGIIDVVNSFLAVALSHGLVGLSLFIGVFGSLLLRIRRATLRARSLSAEHARVGQVLLAILVAVLIVIGTVSSVEYIPIYYWALAGLGAAYVNFIAVSLKEKYLEEADRGRQSTVAGATTAIH